MNLALVLDKPKKTLKIILMIVKKRIHFENEKAWSQGFVPKVGNMLEEISQGYLCLNYIVINIISDVESLLGYGNLPECIKNRKVSITTMVNTMCFWKYIFTENSIARLHVNFITLAKKKSIWFLQYNDF